MKHQALVYLMLSFNLDNDYDSEKDFNSET